MACKIILPGTVDGLQSASLDNFLPTQLPIPRPYAIQAPHCIPSLHAFVRSTVYFFLHPQSLRGQTKVIIQGVATSGETFDAEIPLEVVEAHSLTIQFLAAKALMADLESGQSWMHNMEHAGYRNRDPIAFERTVQQEAAQIGVKWAISGKWTSFVAVDSADQTEQESQTYLAERSELADLTRPRDFNYPYQNNSHFSRSEFYSTRYSPRCPPSYSPPPLQFRSSYCPSALWSLRPSLRSGHALPEAKTANRESVIDRVDSAIPQAELKNKQEIHWNSIRGDMSGEDFGSLPALDRASRTFVFKRQADAAEESFIDFGEYGEDYHDSVPDLSLPEPSQPSTTEPTATKTPSLEPGSAFGSMTDHYDQPGWFNVFEARPGLEPAYGSYSTASSGSVADSTAVRPLTVRLATTGPLPLVKANSGFAASSMDLDRDGTSVETYGPQAAEKSVQQNINFGRACKPQLELQQANEVAGPWARTPATRDIRTMALHEIVELQSVEGFFSVPEDIDATLPGQESRTEVYDKIYRGIRVRVLITKEPDDITQRFIVVNRIYSTLIILFILERKFDTEKYTWSLVASKASKWLESTVQDEGLLDGLIVLIRASVRNELR